MLAKLGGLDLQDVSIGLLVSFVNRHFTYSKLCIKCIVNPDHIARRTLVTKTRLVVVVSQLCTSKKVVTIFLIFRTPHFPYSSILFYIVCDPLPVA